MTTIGDIEETFDLLDGWEEKYAFLIDLGRKLPPFPEEQRNEATLVSGCVSKVWLVISAEEDSRLRIFTDSDAHIVRGLLAIIIAACDGKRPEEVLKEDIGALFDRLGLAENLSPNRRNGFFAVAERIRAWARRCVEFPQTKNR